MATVLAIILAVALDRYARNYAGGKFLQGVRTSAWLNPYLVKCINLLDKIGIKQNFLIIVAALLPICIGLFLFKLLFGMLLGERVGQFVFTALILFYYLGIKDVEEQSSEFVLAHELSFGILFWYTALGFSGALLYWFLVLAKQTAVVMDPINTGLRQALVVTHALAAWIPARITGFLYALMGNFDPGFKCWLNCIRDVKMPSTQVLLECGKASVASSSAENEQSLVNRTFIAWVVLVIIVVML